MTIKSDTQIDIITNLSGSTPKLTFIQQLRRRLKRHVIGSDIHGMLEGLPSFVPYSKGHPASLLTLTLQAANETLPLLAKLAAESKRSSVPAASIKEFIGERLDENKSERLRILFDNYGSDKGTFHRYHHLYEFILSDINSIQSLLEIGLGSNNIDVISNMGASGKPGASLRAFRDYLPEAMIYGADIDRRILFSEQRIETFYVDQTDIRSLNDIGKKLPDQLDIVIDDGLHAMNANISVLLFSLDRLKQGGWLIIEDISPDAIALWKVVDALMPNNFNTKILQADSCLMYVAKKMASV